MDPIRDPFILEREKGLFARNNPCLRKVAVKPFGLALAVLVSSAKFALWTSSMTEFCRTLFSGSQPTLFTGKIKDQVFDLIFYFRAGKGFRTLDIDLGKVALYQLSYSRIDVALI